MRAAHAKNVFICSVNSKTCVRGENSVSKLQTVSKDRIIVMKIGGEMFKWHNLFTNYSSTSKMISVGMPQVAKCNPA